MSETSIKSVRQQLLQGKAKEFLNFAGKVFAYTFDEITELYLADASVNAVATGEQWEKLGFRLRSDAQGISLSSNKTVYDVAQTNAPHRFGRFEYLPDAKAHIIERYRTYSRNSARLTSASIEEAIYDFVNWQVTQSSYSSEYIKNHKELIADCAIYTVFARLDLLTPKMYFDFSNISSAVSTDKDTVEFLSAYRECIYNTLILTRKAVWQAQAELEKKNEAIEQAMSDREAFADTADELYNYRTGNSWHIVKVQNVYTNNKGVQIYTLGGINGDKFKVTLSKAQFEKLALPVIVDDNREDVIEQIEDKPGAAVVEVVETVTETNAVDEFKNKTYELFKPVDDFSAAEIEKLTKDYINTVFYEEKISASVVDLAIVGSRSRGLENDNSDIDVAVEVSSDELKEDALFNILHDEEFTIGDTIVDINPIRAEESGTLADYLERAEIYLSEKKEASTSKATEQLTETETQPTIVEDKGPITLNRTAEGWKLRGINARNAAEVLGLELSKEYNDDVCSFDESFKDNYFQQLRDAGYSILIAETFELGTSKKVNAKTENTEEEDIISYAEKMADTVIPDTEDELVEEDEPEEQTSRKGRGRKVSKSTSDYTPTRKYVLDAEQPVFQITQDMFDYVLRCGNPNGDFTGKSYNYPQSIYAIINQFAVNGTELNAEYLKSAFSGTARGYFYRTPDGSSVQRITVRFDDDLIKITAGTSSDNPFGEAFYTYEDAAKRISEMLENGTYCEQQHIDDAQDTQLFYISERLWYLHQDTEDFYDYFIPEEMFKGGAPDSMQRIYESLKDEDTFNTYLEGMKKFVSDYANNRNILRWHIHQPDELLSIFENAGLEHRQFNASPDFTLQRHFFVSDDEVDLVLMNEGVYSKFDFVEYHKTLDTSEFAKKIKDTYGTGGGSSIHGLWKDHDRKGLAIYFGYSSNNEKLHLSYAEIAQRISRMIDSGEYITEKDRADYLRSLKYDIRQYYEDKLKWELKEPSKRYSWDAPNEPFFNKTVDRLKALGADVETIIAEEQANAQETIDNIPVPAIMRDTSTTETSEDVPESETVSQPEAVVVEAEEPKELTDSFDEVSRDKDENAELIEFANEFAAANAEIEKDMPQENEQLSFFSFGAAPSAPVKTYALLLSKSDDTVTPSIINHYDKLKAVNHIYEEKYYVYKVYGENKPNAQKDLIKLRSMLRDHTLDVDYYLSLIPSDEQKSYIDKVSARHLPLVYEKQGDVAPHCIFRGKDAEIISRLTNHVVTTEYDESTKTNRLTVTLQEYEINSNADKLSAVGYYFVDKNEFEQQEKPIIETVKVGDFWEVYDEDAHIVSEALGLHITKKNGRDMVGFPDHVRDIYHEQLKSAGYGIMMSYGKLSDTIRASSKIIDVTAQNIYDHLVSSFPRIMDKTYTYMRYSKGENSGFMPLTLEWVGEDVLSIAHTYTQNGDLMDDPEIRLVIDNENGVANCISYSNSGMGIYREYEVGDAQSKDCNDFMTTWLNNIDHTHYSLMRTIRINEEGVDIEQNYGNRPLDENRLDIFFVEQNGRYTAYNRLEKSSDEQYDVIAEIAEDGNAVINNSELVPSYYKTQIERYGKRKFVDPEVFNACAVIRYVKDFGNGSSEYRYDYEPQGIRELAHNSKYVDREIAKLIDDIALKSQTADFASRTYNLSDDELDFVVSRISSALAEYKKPETYISDIQTSERAILNDSTKDVIYNSVFVQLETLNKLNEEAPEIDTISEPKKVYQVITDDDDSGIDDKSEYSSEQSAIAAGKRYLDEGYRGYAVWNTETKRILDYSAEFRLEQGFNPEILRENGYYEEAARAQTLIDSIELLENPEKETTNPYEIEVGDTVNALGSGDRELVVTAVNDDGTVEVRDDNTGWYPIFQTLPIEQISSTKETLSAKEEIETPIIPERKDYVIADDSLGVLTPKERAKANLNALELLDKLKEENRIATSEEQNVLAQYTGWGALPDVFDERKDNYSSEREKLQELLTDNEYRSANDSILTAFYTQPVIVRSVYRALGNFGFEGGKILEPACGVGNFFGMMPEEMRTKSELHGVEIDRVSGQIARNLYPNAKISICGYEDTKFSDNSFDVVVGNVPFGSFKVFDNRYNRHNLLIHDYYFIKTLDKVKPGGIVAFITSSGTLDKKDSKTRKMMCERAELLGAVRLPYTAFKGNAGTEVVSDIIFLKKRENITAIRENWVETTYEPSARANVNNYFLEHPEMVCGKLTNHSTAYGYDMNVEPFEDISLEDALNERIDKIIGKYEPVVSTLKLSEEDKKEDQYINRIDDSIPDFCYGVIPSGEIVYRTGDLLKVKNTTEKSKKQYKAAIRVSRAVRHIIDIQQEIPNEENKDRIERDFETARAELNAAYDSYRASFGDINNSTNLRKKFDFREDRNFSLMCSLEKVVEVDGKKSYEKSSELFIRRTIFKKPEIKHCDTINDAFLVSLNIRSRIDIAYISELTDKPVSEIINELDGVFMYRNPETAKEDDITTGWEPIDQYLSGNIRTKLQKAKDAAANDKSYEKNVTALEKVMPERLTAADITCQLGSSWIPVDVISQFMMEIFNLPSYMKTYCEIEHNIPTATWNIQHKSMSRGIEASTVYGSPDMNGLEVLENSLNRRSCVIYDRVRDEDGNMISKKNPEKTREIGLKQDALQQAFIDWVYTDAERTSRLEDIYNNLYNSERVRKFDGSFLTFDGMNENVYLKEHQKNAVARVLFGGNSLLAHVVGAGKTFEMAAAVMELKRTGAANKSLIVVPNHLIGQWEKEFLTLYPGANIFAATSEDFKKKNRKIFTARMATGDYDAIIMGYSTFSKIGISAERRKMYYKQQIDECELMLLDAEKGSLSEKMLKKKLKNFENSLKSMEYVVKQDDEITFEELGVDRLFIDEAHNYKNLQVLTKLGNVKGLQNTRSKRAEDLLFKIRYINELQGDERGVVLATGTPISNSMTEMFVMQKYLQNDYLERKGLGHFDAWISDFGKIEKVIELNPTGQGFRMTKRCSSFNNLPELMVMFNRCTDIQTAEMLNLPIPKLKNGEYTISVCHPSEIQKEFIKHCGERADAVRSGSVDPSVDNMLCITNDGKMCALDMRLVDEDADDLPESKINTAVRNIFNKWIETEEQRLTQIVFLDRSTPTGDGSFNLYDDIRDKLVRMGVPKDEIRFIHEAKNDEQKLALFDDVNAGKVRVIIGSTEKMGAGTNIQTRLCALHHLDVPWRPSDIEQREGRILRQGNLNSEVEIFRYVTEGTFDAYSWQTIESKQKFISQVMTGNAAGRSAEDVDSAVLNYAQIKALATGDPRIKEHFDLEQEVNDLRTRKGQFNKAHFAMRDRLNKELPQIIATETKFVGIFKSAKEYAAANSKPFDDEHNPFKVTFCNREYDKREDAGKKIFDIINSGAAYQEAYKVGQYRGFDLSIMFSASSQSHVMTLKHGDCSITKEVPESSIGIFMRLDNMINKSIDELLVAHSQKLSSAVKEKETCEQHANDKFPQAEELIEKEKRLRELAAALSLDKAADENADMLSETPDDGDPINSPGDGGRK